MDLRGQFDKKIDLYQGKIPSDVLDALVWVNDTMEFAKASAEQVFGEGVSSKTVVDVYDRVIAKTAKSGE